MQYVSYYASPLGDILLAANEAALTGLWFEGQKYFALNLNKEYRQKEIPLFTSTKQWLDTYFSGKKPNHTIPLHFIGTAFQKQVWEALLHIPYGKSVTYGEIARQIATKRGLAHMSAQAIGGAIGRNPISIIVPCHRVVGINGSITGYAAGVDKKIWLLQLEKIDMKSLCMPKIKKA